MTVVRKFSEGRLLVRVRAPPNPQAQLQPQVQKQPQRQQPQMPAKIREQQTVVSVHPVGVGPGGAVHAETWDVNNIKVPPDQVWERRPSSRSAEQINTIGHRTEPVDAIDHDHQNCFGSDVHVVVDPNAVSPPKPNGTILSQFRLADTTLLLNIKRDSSNSRSPSHSPTKSWRPIGPATVCVPTLATRTAQPVSPSSSQTSSPCLSPLHSFRVVPGRVVENDVRHLRIPPGFTKARRYTRQEAAASWLVST